MYKVFVNDKAIILTDSLSITNKYVTYIFDEIVVDELVYRLKKDNIQGIHLYCKDIEFDWEKFQASFKVIIAAGGLVTNHEKEILFINRFNTWDLPKGRVERGESIEEAALREVEEECGIKDLELKYFLTTTYHLFYMDHIQQMKITHWYYMTSQFHEDLTPQLEEGITEVLFKNQEQINEAQKNTYENIKLVLKEYHKANKK